MQSYTSILLKKGPHQSNLGRQKMACTSSKTEILNKIGI